MNRSLTGHYSPAIAGGIACKTPDAGSAGFLIAADAYIKQQTDDLFDLNAREQKFQMNK